MDLSKRIARIAGPTLIVLSVTEALNLAAFAGNPAPLVYLNGTLLFIAGLSIVQAHNRWADLGRVLVTLIGWVCLAAGLLRMAAPQGPQLGPGPATTCVFVLLVAAGTVLTFFGYRLEGRPGR